MPFNEAFRIGARIQNHDRADKHLRSSGEVIGYHVQALGRHIGTLEDLIIDTESWKVIFLVINTSGNEMQTVHPPVNTFREINWENREVVIDLSH